MAAWPPSASGSEIALRLRHTHAPREVESREGLPIWRMAGYYIIIIIIIIIYLGDRWSGLPGGCGLHLEDVIKTISAWPFK